MTLLFDDKLSLAPIGDNPQVRWLVRPCHPATATDIYHSMFST